MRSHLILFLRVEYSILTGAWVLFYLYSNQETNRIQEIIEKFVSPAVWENFSV